MGVTDRVGDLCAPLCERVGVELLDVEYNGGVLRVTIDHPDGVGMDAIAVLTDVEGERRLVGTLEQADSDGITVRTPVGDVRALRYDEIQKARTVFEWDSGAARKSSDRGRAPQPTTDESEVGR